MYIKSEQSHEKFCQLNANLEPMFLFHQRLSYSEEGIYSAELLIKRHILKASTPYVSSPLTYIFNKIL